MITLFNTRVTEVVLDPNPEGKSVTINLQDTAFPQKKLTFVTKDLSPRWHVGQVVTVYFHRKDGTSAVLPEHEDGMYLLSCYGKAVYSGIGKYNDFSADFQDEDQVSSFQINAGSEAWTTDIVIDEDYVLSMVVIL